MKKRQVFVIGDVHSDYDGFDNTIRLIEKEHGSLTCDDVIFIAGDAGFVFDYDNKWMKKHKRRKRRINKYPFHIFVVLGNHENYELIYRFPQKVIFGAKTFKEEGVNVHYIQNGEVLTIDFQRFWCYGGGLSIDKTRREMKTLYEGEPKSWWKEEIDKENFEKGINNFEKIDFVITHDVPRSVYYQLKSILNIHGKQSPLQPYFESFYQNDSFTRWFAGHYHPRYHIPIDKKILILPILGYHKII
jgi:predicted phosphodiesterase